jgi:hypothetical protein
MIYKTRVLIDLEKYGELLGVSLDEISCEFKKQSFHLKIERISLKNVYSLAIKKTREEILPEKCKFYLKKNTLFVQLFKKVSNSYFTSQKEEGWWTLRGFES